MAHHHSLTHTHKLHTHMKARSQWCKLKRWNPPGQWRQHANCKLQQIVAHVENLNGSCNVRTSCVEDRTKGEKCRPKPHAIPPHTPTITQPAWCTLAHTKTNVQLFLGCAQARTHIPQALAGLQQHWQLLQEFVREGYPGPVAEAPPLLLTRHLSTVHAPRMK